MLLLVTELLPLHRKLKVFDENKEHASRLIAMDFSEFTDNEIIKIYLP